MDIEKIASAIEALAKDKSLRDTMGIVGQNRVRAFYQKKDFLDRYEALYQSY
jgi:glycosyltransferase involved in cell wall biosynthesis